MKLYIPKDMFDNYHPPRLFLCTTGKKRIGELHNYETNLHGKWKSYSELNFSIDRTYVDVLTGETKVNPLFDKAEGLRMVLIDGMGYCIIQDPDSTLSDKDMKSLSCFSSEYACAQKYLEQFYINTGEEDSKEVIYLSSIYGDGYRIDERYQLATGEFDAYESYYMQQYSNTDSYVYEQVQVANAEEYAIYIAKNNNPNAQPHEKLYVHKYPNVRFYWPSKPELSLLHLVFEKIPEWSIGNVDTTLWRKERKFSEERISVYDFLGNNVSDTFNCVVEWDTLTNRVNFYEEANDGISEDGTVQSRFETDVYISRENLATELSVSYSTDDIKTKLSVSGSDNLDIREVNLGKNYIMNLDYYHNSDWMEPDLLEAYDDYLETVEEYSPEYTASMQGWVSAYNKWNDLMNAVPAEGNVVLVGDEFKKLYCVYSPIDTAYLSQTIIDSNVNTLIVDNLYELNDHTKAIDKTTLSDKATFIVQGYSFVYVKTNNNFKCSENMDAYSLDKLTNIKDGKLHLYHVDEDIEANKNDNILLRLKNLSSDVATIRIYNSGTVASPTYLIQTIVVSASTGTSQTAKTYTMNQWINGELTAEKMGFEGYKITYIGTMGAYFVLAKDETQEATLEEYGVNLLKEKHNTYVTIFQTQTEAMFSQQDYQCIVQNDTPQGDYDNGTRWLDTDSNPVKLYAYNKTLNTWSVISERVSDTDQSNYENYQRYLDNYEKMVAVQKMLLKKEKEAGYWLNGYEVAGRVINYKNGDNGNDFYRVADAFFRTDGDGDFIITNGTLHVDLIPIYTFTTPKAEGNFAVYLVGNVPYVAHAESQGVYQAKMNAIAQLTELANFFTKEQWIALSPLIREDEYSDDNFLLTGYESEEERLEICKELMESATKELKTLSQPSLEFSMTMANILALSEFEPIISQFELGNFIRIELRPGIIKRARLLECTINFDDLSDFSCTFGNLITTKSEIDLHAELLQQAVTAGKTVATAASDWQSAVDKANKLEESIMGGLQDAALQVGRASGQAISWDDRGFFCRKFVDGSTDTYLDEQIAIINNKIVFTNDGWKTSKAALGEFEVDTNGDGIKERLYGLLADAVVSGYISGSVIEGGSLKIGGSGGKFVVNEDGSVEILGPDETPLYAGSSAVSEINDAYKYTVELLYNGSTVFASTEGRGTIVTAVVKDYGEDITHKLPIGSKFTWLRNGATYKTTTIDENNQPKKDIINTNYDSLTANQINIKHTDIEGNAFFSCQVDFDEKQIIKEGE